MYVSQLDLDVCVLAVYFVVLYAVVPVTFIRGMRRQPHLAPNDYLDPVEIGLLRSNVRAIVVVVAELLRQGVLTVDGSVLRPIAGRTYVRTMAGVEVLGDRLARGMSVDVRELPKLFIHDIRLHRRELARRGYFLEMWPGIAGLQRVLIILIVVGFVLVLPLSSRGVPTWICMLTFPVAGFMLILLQAIHSSTEIRLWRRSYPSRAAYSTIQTLEEQQRHLHPGNRPAWRAYGSSAAVTATALFGAAAVADLFPELGWLESELELITPRARATANLAAGDDFGDWSWISCASVWSSEGDGDGDGGGGGGGCGGGDGGGGGGGGGGGE